MATFTDADKATIDLAKKTIHDHHPDLEAADLTVCYLFAHGKDGGPDLKHHGYPAAAIIKINSYEARVSGLADVTLKIAASKWKDMSDQQKRALLRHEFMHLILVKEEDGSVATDDADRPKLKMRLHDSQVGVFYDVIQEFGEDSLDYQMIKDVFKTPVIQGMFHWG